jgi:hypothetical protein
MEVVADKMASNNIAAGSIFVTSAITGILAVHLMVWSGLVWSGLIWSGLLVAWYAIRGGELFAFSPNGI